MFNSYVSHYQRVSFSCQAPEWFDSDPHYCDPMHNDKSVAWPTRSGRSTSQPAWWRTTHGPLTSNGMSHQVVPSYREQHLEKAVHFLRAIYHCQVRFGRMPSRPDLHPQSTCATQSIFWAATFPHHLWSCYSTPFLAVFLFML